MGWNKYDFAGIHELGLDFFFFLSEFKDYEN